jgi:tRNA-specific 2-thiouridylase
MRVLMAMSGGVDSSTAAAILRDQGHEVVGVGLRLPGGREGAGRACCSLTGMQDAAAVARRLGIPFYVLDYRDLFEREVIEDFCSAYLAGRTPNPCVRCNDRIKFGHLMQAADRLGAERVATGHYARTDSDARTGRHLLLKGADPDQDQSYFLYGLSQQQLARAMFPLGEMSKGQTRALARRCGLKVADKAASQDICFVGEEGYRSFLSRRCPQTVRPGAIVDVEGRAVGRHAGCAFFTIGQRRGLRVAAGRPQYVVEIRPEAAAVVVGSWEYLMTDRVDADGMNWIACERPPERLRVTVRLRHRQPEAPAVVLSRGPAEAEVVLDRPQQATAPGQSIVLYDGDTVVGGGTVLQCVRSLTTS